MTPDGKYWVIPGEKTRTSEHCVLIGDSATLKPVKCFELPEGEFSKELFATGSQGNSHSPDTDPGSCVMFSPNGGLMAVAQKQENEEAKQALSSYGKQSCGRRSPPYRVTLLKGQLGRLPTLNCSVSRRTASSLLVSSSVTPELVVEDATRERGHLGRSKCEGIPAISACQYLRRPPGKTPPGKTSSTVSVSGQHDVGRYQSKEQWSDKANGVVTTLSVKGWDLVDGHERITLQIFVGTKLFGSCVAISPDHRILITRIDKNLRVWDLDHLGKLQNDVIEGDRLWESGSHSEAFKHYCALVGDEMAWFVEGNLPLGLGHDVSMRMRRREM